MAISSVHYSIVRELFRNQLLPQHGAILALGEVRWGDDIDPRALNAEITTCVADPARQAELLERLAAASPLPAAEKHIAIANLYHEMFFTPREVLTIDNAAPFAASQYDLNEPLAIERRFDVTINYGAAERVFDIAQVFITMHDRTAPGGLMLHECAFNGWVDHAYYTVQPTLFFDLAEVNGYRLLALFIEDIAGQRALRLFSRDTIIELMREQQVAENAKLFAVLTKGVQEHPFQIPMQGYYAKRLSETAERAWLELR